MVEQVVKLGQAMLMLCMQQERQLLNRKRLGELSDQNSEVLVIQNILQAILCTRKGPIDSQGKGTCAVIGQEGQQVLAKHRNIYTNVNPCKLQLKDTYKIS